MRYNRNITICIFLAAALAAGSCLAGCDEEKSGTEVLTADIPVEKDGLSITVEKYTDGDANTDEAADGDASSEEDESETSDETEESDTGAEEESTEEDTSEQEDEEEDTEETGDETAEDEKDDDEDPEETDTEEPDSKEGSEAAGPVTPGSVESIGLNPSWTYADYSAINSGSAKLYRAADNRKGVVIGVNAGHGTSGGSSVKTYCHPDMTPKVTGGSTGAGAIKAAAVSGGMSFADGTSEASVALREAQILRDKLLSKGYDVLMLRDDPDVQLDNIARTVIANNTAACLISLHWDGDNLSYDKGCFYISTPSGIKGMEPVASHWQQHEALGQSLISGLSANGCKIHGGGSMSIDLTQTSYSTIPSVDVELGNAASAHDDATLSKLADGLVSGITGMY